MTHSKNILVLREYKNLKQYHTLKRKIVLSKANKEVNRHIRNVTFDTRVIDTWVDSIPIIEILLNSSAKAPTGVAHNLIIMGRIKLPSEGILTDFHYFNNTALRARGYLDQIFKRQMMLLMLPKGHKIISIMRSLENEMRDMI